MERIPMSPEGLNNLEEELKRLRTEERPAVIQAIADAREHGDLAENAEYHAARERQSFIEGRLAELEDVISRAEVIHVSNQNPDVVRFGATVDLADEDTEEVATYTLVGTYEADASAGRLSVTSPLGRAMIGKGLGDEVEVSTPRGEKTYEIIKIAYKQA
ncbi:MAG: transcription elongation factor GreA [Rhodospirillales bacterium]|nr:transcription elongation factor GreA [Rhodospirillales bacterium]